MRGLRKVSKRIASQVFVARLEGNSQHCVPVVDSAFERKKMTKVNTGDSGDRMSHWKICDLRQQSMS
jgi:hypothetical protein